MVIFLDNSGNARIITPENVYQGSNNVTEITAIAPFAPQTAMQIGFILPNEQYWEAPSVTNDYGDVQPGGNYAPMCFVKQDFTTKANVWKFSLPHSVTEFAGEVKIAINAISHGKAYVGSGEESNCTSYLCAFNVQESVVSGFTPEPDHNTFDLLTSYLSFLDGRTANVPNLVKGVEKTASNAFRPILNNGARAAELVLWDEEHPVPIAAGAASVVDVPASAWSKAFQSATYQTTVTAAAHGQMRDDATAQDLWVSAEILNGEELSNQTVSYTVNNAGDIMFGASKPVAMTVKVWNGKGVEDLGGRKLIADNENRISALETDVSELQNTGVDVLARQQIADEIARAEQAESDIRNELHAELDTKLNLSGGTVNGLIEVMSPNDETRAELDVISDGNVPCDLFFGTNGKKKFSFTARNDGSPAQFGMWDLVNGRWVFEYANNFQFRVPIKDKYGYEPFSLGNLPPVATASRCGTVKPVSVIPKPDLNEITTETGKYYSVQMSADGEMFVNVPWTPGKGTIIDATLSVDSENPVQNKVIKESIDSKLNKSGDTMGGELTLVTKQKARGYLEVTSGTILNSSNYKSGFYHSAWAQYGKYILCGDGTDKFALGWQYGSGLWLREINNSTMKLERRIMTGNGDLLDKSGNIVYSQDNPPPKMNYYELYSTTSVTTGTKTLNNGYSLALAITNGYTHLVLEASSSIPEYVTQLYKISDVYNKKLLIPLVGGGSTQKYVVIQFGSNSSATTFSVLGVSNATNFTLYAVTL